MAAPLGDLTRCLRMYDTAEETLFNLGLAPNRCERQRDFLVYDTVGRLPKGGGLGAASAGRSSGSLE